MQAKGAAADDDVEQLHAECAAIGFDLQRAGGSLVERMRLLSERSGTFDGAR